MANENDEIEKDGEESDEAKKPVASPSSSPAPVASAAGAGALADETKAGAVDDDESHDASDDEEAEELVVAKATNMEAAPPARPALPSEPADEGPEPAPERDSPGMRLITTAFVVVAITVIGIVIGTKEYFTSVMDAELETKVAEPVSNQLLDLHKLEDARLSKYQWVSKDKGVVRIPVDKAKEMVLARYQSEPIEEPPPPPPPPTTGEVPVEPPPDAPGGEKKPDEKDGVIKDGEHPGKDGTKPGKDGEKQPEAPVPPPPQEKAPEKKKAPTPPPPPGEPVP